MTYRQGLGLRAALLGGAYVGAWVLFTTGMNRAVAMDPPPPGMPGDVLLALLLFFVSGVYCARYVARAIDRFTGFRWFYSPVALLVCGMFGMMIAPFVVAYLLFQYLRTPA